MFDSTYNDLPAAKLQSSMQCNNLQVMLREAGVSFMTKIVKHKKRGKEFIVMLVEQA
jgi:hypothetical protein